LPKNPLGPVFLAFCALPLVALAQNRVAAKPGSPVPQRLPTRIAGEAGAAGALSTVAQVRALPPGRVATGLPVELHAVLTYYQPGQGQVFVQDATGGIYVVPPANAPDLKEGDAVVVRGVTVPSFLTNVKAGEIRVLSEMCVEYQYPGRIRGAPAIPGAKRENAMIASRTPAVTESKG